MKRAFLFILLAAAATLAAQEPDVTGDWQGTLTVGPDQIHLTLHISAGDNGTLKATMDSAKLTLTMDSIHGTYDGTVNSARGAIAGTWSQGQPMPLTFTRPPKSTGSTKLSELEGIWQGTLQVGGRQLRLVFHITTAADGLAATVDSPDQSASGLPVTSARRDGDTLVLQLPDLGAKFQGTIAKDLSAIDGAFTQGGASLPLTLKRNADAK